MKFTVFLGFREGELITIVESVKPNFKDAVKVDHVLTDPKDVEKQIGEWRKK